MSRIDADKQLLLSPLTNHWGHGKSVEHGHRFGQFNRVVLNERSEQVVDRQTGYRWELEESFRYQNTMSNGTTQEKATMTPKLRDVQQERQLQLAADRQKAEELRLQVEQAPQARTQPAAGTDYPARAEAQPRARSRHVTISRTWVS